MCRGAACYRYGQAVAEHHGGKEESAESGGGRDVDRQALSFAFVGKGDVEGIIVCGSDTEVSGGAVTAVLPAGDIPNLAALIHFAQPGAKGWVNNGHLGAEPE